MTILRTDPEADPATGLGSKATMAHQFRKILACEQEPNGSSLSRDPRNAAVGLQRDDHLVHRRWTNPKVPLHVGLGGRLTVDLAVVVEREILILFVRERFRRHEGSVLVSVGV